MTRSKLKIFIIPEFAVPDGIVATPEQLSAVRKTWLITAFFLPTLNIEVIYMIEKWLWPKLTAESSKWIKKLHNIFTN